MSQLSLKKIKLGDNADTSKNFVISTPAVADGTLTIERENGTDVLTIDASGDVTLTGKLKQAVQSMVRLNTANGYGSTSTHIRRFTNVVTNQGTDITYTDSATLGSTFTIEKGGVYAITYLSQFSVANTAGTVTLNTSNPAAAPSVASEILTAAQSSVANIINSASWIGYLPEGSVVRPHNSSASNAGTNTLYDSFTIARVA